MAFDNRSLDDYVDVAERIAEFRDRYPDGSLQPFDPLTPFEIRKVEGIDKHGKEFTATFVVYAAAAYRDRDDKRPGIGVAWEVFPGRTPYTLGSELMNAETSAWGRAIVATLAADAKRGVASRQEVRARIEEDEERNGASGGRWMNRRPDAPPTDLQARRTRTKTTGPEHEQLRAGTVEATPEDRPAQRIRTIENGDPWLDQPAGVFEPYEPEKAPGSIDGRQKSIIFARLTELATDADVQRQILSDILRRDVTSRKDVGQLSRLDADTVLEDLETRVKAKRAAEAARKAAAEQDAAAEATT